VDLADVCFAGAARQARLVRSRELSPSELVEATLRRIEDVEHELNCYIRVLGDEAIEEAAAVERRMGGGDAELPLAGVPVAIKDNTDIAGQRTSHGTRAVERIAPADSAVVRRLRAAGAVVVGKTSLPELAQWGHMTASRAFGTTRNPWDRRRSPGGSSGGSAAAVAAGLCGAALGSDGGASIRVPGAMCGVFGLKPQRQRVSMLPDHDHWFGLTVFGPLTRTVADAALFMEVAGDLPPPPGPPPRLRVAVSFKPYLPLPVAASQRSPVERTADLLRQLGHQVGERDPRFGVLFPDMLPRYLAGIAGDADRLDRPERLEPRTLAMARAGRRMRGRPLARSYRREQAAAARQNRVFEDHDVLLTPVTAAPTPPAHISSGHGAVRTFNDMGPYVAFTVPWNYTGQPAASVPAGFDEQGMPQAVLLVGRPHAEATLLALAAQLEEARPWADRRPPA
jgi:amidase